MSDTTLYLIVIGLCLVNALGATVLLLSAQTAINTQAALVAVTKAAVDYYNKPKE